MLSRTGSLTKGDARGERKRPMRRTALLAAIALLVAGTALAAMACGGGEEPDLSATPTAIGIEGTPASTQPLETPTSAGATVQVNLAEWIVAPEPDEVAAGTITFNPENIGGNHHELLIIKTGLERDALPTKDDGSFDEAGPDVQVVGQIQEMESEGSGSVAVALESGAYVLICNVVDQSGSHYSAGMSAAFQVTP